MSVYSLLSYSQRFLVLALSSVSSGCVCGCVCVCELGHIWLAFDLGEALRCMPKMWTVGLQLIVTCPWLCGGAYCWEASSQFSAAAFRGEGSFLFVSYWFFYNCPFLVVDKASLTPPGSQFRAPSRLLLKIYWLPLSPPHFPRFGYWYTGSVAPGSRWKAYGQFLVREF